MKSKSKRISKQQQVVNYLNRYYSLDQGLISSKRFIKAMRGYDIVTAQKLTDKNNGTLIHPGYMIHKLMDKFEISKKKAMNAFFTWWDSEYEYRNDLFLVFDNLFAVAVKDREFDQLNGNHWLSDEDYIFLFPAQNLHLNLNQISETVYNLLIPEVKQKTTVGYVAVVAEMWTMFLNFSAIKTVNQNELYDRIAENQVMNELNKLFDVLRNVDSFDAEWIAEATRVRDQTDEHMMDLVSMNDNSEFLQRWKDKCVEMVRFINNKLIELGVEKPIQ